MKPNHIPPHDGQDQDYGRRRVVIENVTPEVVKGEFPIKREAGDLVVVEADVFVDGHDTIASVLLHKKEGASSWEEAPMELVQNDRWRGSFRVEELGRYRYTLMGWVDHFATWYKGFVKKYEAGQDVSSEMLIGARIITDTLQSVSGADANRLETCVHTLTSDTFPLEAKIGTALSEELVALMRGYQERRFATVYPVELSVIVDRKKARFSAWYEMFPRSATPRNAHHGTFKDVEGLLPYIQEMGFDVLYLAPIHPIGKTKRKGKNGAVVCQPDDPGSPWAIGSEEGGHKAVHPELGTLEDFRALVARAKDFGIEIALDIAYQCSPDHPYVKEHPEWFRIRPDGGIQYAENPPKRYEDIVPFDFECKQWPSLWEELASIVLFWIEQGVRVFRVDNPHTKPFRFWQWLIPRFKAAHPDVLFLSEAHTRPKVMYRLAKVGFCQSYTYFPWKIAKWELEQYFTELTKTQAVEFFRPSLWVNTPDILTEYLQTGGRPAFMTRLILAATLGSNYGVYGPAFELMERLPREKGSEEYLNSEKYEVRTWDLESHDSLRGSIAQLNRIRGENPALQGVGSLTFHPTEHESIVCFSKRTPDRSNTVVVVVNLDPFQRHWTYVNLNLAELGIDADETYDVFDTLSETTYVWRGAWNYVELDPASRPAHILVLKKRTGPLGTGQ